MKSESPGHLVKGLEQVEGIADQIGQLWASFGGSGTGIASIKLLAEFENETLIWRENAEGEMCRLEFTGSEERIDKVGQGNQDTDEIQTA